MRAPLATRRFEFALSEDEVAHLARAIAARQKEAASTAPFFLGLVLGVPVVGLSVLTAIGFGLVARLEARSVIIAAMLAYFLGFFAAYLQTKLERRHRLRELCRDVAGSEPLAVEVSTEGVSVKTGGTRRVYDWSAIAAAEISGPMLTVWSAGAIAVAIPLRLISKDDALALLEQIRDRAGGGGR